MDQSSTAEEPARRDQYEKSTRRRRRLAVAKLMIGASSHAHVHCDSDDSKLRPIGAPVS